MHSRGQPCPQLRGNPEPEIFETLYSHAEKHRAQISTIWHDHLLGTDHEYTIHMVHPMGRAPQTQIFHKRIINIQTVWPSSTIIIRLIDHSQATPRHGGCRHGSTNPKGGNWGRLLGISSLLMAFLVSSLHLHTHWVGWYKAGITTATPWVGQCIISSKGHRQ